MFLLRGHCLYLQGLQIKAVEGMDGEWLCSEDIKTLWRSHSEPQKCKNKWTNCQLICRIFSKQINDLVYKLCSSQFTRALADKFKLFVLSNQQFKPSEYSLSYKTEKILTLEKLHLNWFKIVADLRFSNSTNHFNSCAENPAGEVWILVLQFPSCFRWSKQDV